MSQTQDSGRGSQVRFSDVSDGKSVSNVSNTHRASDALDENDAFEAGIAGNEVQNSHPLPRRWSIASDTSSSRRRSFFLPNESDSEDTVSEYSFDPDRADAMIREVLWKLEGLLDHFAKGEKSVGAATTTSNAESSVGHNVPETIENCVENLRMLLESGMIEPRTSVASSVQHILQTRLAQLNRRSADDRAVATWVENTFAEGLLPSVRRSSSSPTPSSDNVRNGDLLRVRNGSRRRRQHDRGIAELSSKHQRLTRSRSDTDIAKSLGYSESNFSRSQSVRQRKRGNSRRKKKRLSSMPVFSTECDSLLKHLTRWDMNIFTLAKVSQGRPLTALGMKLFETTGLIEEFKIDPLVLTRFFIAVEEEYGRAPEVPYHNNVHAADVLHSTSVLLNLPELSKTPSLEKLAAFIAAAVHDIGHPGLTNQFLVETQHPYSVLYNDKSVLENFHAATAFKLLSDAKLNVLASLSKADRTAVRKMIIAMILGTDMALHFKHLAEFRSVVENLKSSAEKPSRTRSGRPSSSAEADKQGFRDSDSRVLMCAVVHLADMGNPTKPWDLCQKWTGHVMNEFFRQGDQEKAKGLPVGPLHDRDTVNIPKSQIGFIDFIVLPLWETWNSLVEKKSVQLDNLHKNHERWAALAGDPLATAKIMSEACAGYETVENQEEVQRRNSAREPAPYSSVILSRENAEGENEASATGVSIERGATGMSISRPTSAPNSRSRSSDDTIRPLTLDRPVAEMTETRTPTPNESRGSRGLSNELKSPRGYPPSRSPASRFQSPTGTRVRSSSPRKVALV